MKLKSTPQNYVSLFLGTFLYIYACVAVFLYCRFVVFLLLFYLLMKRDNYLMLKYVLYIQKHFYIITITVHRGKGGIDPFQVT